MTDEGINWGEGVRPASRDYTPLYDAERHELAYDFFIHDGGLASRWALAASVGDKLVITIGSNQYTTTVDASGNWSVGVPASVISALTEWRGFFVQLARSGYSTLASRWRRGPQPG